MIKINIISPQLKKEVKQRHAYEITKRMGYSLVFMALALSLYFALSQIAIHYYIVNMLKVANAGTKSSERYDKTIKDLNDQIAYIDSIQKNYIYYTDFLREIADKTNGQISLSQISINPANQIISIRGMAANRESLLAFKGALEQSNYLKDIELPLANILQKENISFDIATKMKKYESK